jgi:hypothetical protein
MEDLLPQLLAFPPHPPPKKPLRDIEFDTQIKQLVQILNSIPASKLASGLGADDFLNVDHLPFPDQCMTLTSLYRP